MKSDLHKSAESESVHRSLEEKAAQPWLRMALPLLVSCVALLPGARAGSFTQGNVVVQQADNGSKQNTTITLVEVNSAATSAQPAVQSISLPGTNTNSNPSLSQALRINGSGGTTGYLATSSDGTLLCLAAANALNSSDLGQTTAASILNRAVATLSSSGTLTLPATSYTGTSGNQCRGATTLNDTTWYIADKGGIYTNGATSPSPSANILAVKSFGGTVYASTASSLNTVSAATGGTLTALTAAQGSSFPGTLTDFTLISSGVNGASFDTLYITNGASASSGTIYKFSLVNGAWVANGTYATSFGGQAIVAAGCGATGGTAFTGALLYLTSANGGDTGNSVVKLTDTAGYDSAINITTANNITLYNFATGSSGPIGKGIAFAPNSTALPDLTIGVAGPPGTVAVGANFNFTIIVANSGAASATGVAATFTLPSGLSFVSAADTGSAGFSPVNNSGVVTFSGGNLGAGASETLTVTATAASAQTYAVPIGAGVIDPSNTIAESNENNNLSEATSLLVANLPDLTVDLTGGPATALAATNFTYTLTAGNAGTLGASGVVVQFTLPSGLTFVSAADGGAAGFTGVDNSGVVTFSGGTLAIGASDPLNVTVSAPGTGTITVPVGAAVINPGHSIQESNYGNDTSTSTLSTLITAPDLVITSTTSGAFVPGDASDNYTIYVSNDGTATTSGSTVTVTDSLPAGLTPLAAMNGTTVNGWTISVSGQTVTATRSDTIATGTGYPALVISFSVASGASGPVTNTASVSGGGEVNSSNDTASGTVTIGAGTPFSTAGKLLVSRGHYAGTASTVVVGSQLPNGTTAVASGTYPGVWANESPDPSFGVTAPIYLDVVDPSTGNVLNSYNVTDAANTLLGVNIATSFFSKSELALNPTPDGTGVTFMCYVATPNILDVSNSDTPYHVDPSNPITLTANTGVAPFQRAVIQVDYLGNVNVTPVNPYSGNNGRASVLAQSTDGNNYYFMVGNAGNGSPTGAIASLLSDDTGVQMALPGAGGNTTVVGEVWGTYGSTNGYERGFSIAELGETPDKTGKDMNLRGLTYSPYTNTLYASKGSGGNGINTVYQVGNAGSIPTSANAGSLPITILTGLPQTNGQFPFGLWFASATTLYVADEGQANTTTYDSTNQVYTPALPANNPTAGLQKWVFNGTAWTLAYTLQAGLNLGVPYTYTIANYPTGNNSATSLPWQPANNGLRNIAGKVNGDGTVTVYGITSTVSGETDQGADPNQLVAITDTLSATSLPGGESFTVVESASGLDALRGVALSTPITPNLAASFNLATSVPVTSDGYTAAGIALDPTSLGFAPTTGQVLTLVDNTGSGPIAGTFTGLPEGSTVSASYGGTIYYFTLSYVGGDGNDITLTNQPPGVPVGVQVNGTSGFRRPVSSPAKH